MQKLTTYLFLLIATALITTAAYSQTTDRDALAELDAWVQEQSPEWLPGSYDHFWCLRG